MDRYSVSLVNGSPAARSGSLLPTPPKRSFASRLFGFDIFISFALGSPPRGCQSYASDLARRLRERDFSVFFSEDEAPPGEQLDSTLRSALLHSKTPYGANIRTSRMILLQNNITDNLFGNGKRPTTFPPSRNRSGRLA